MTQSCNEAVLLIGFNRPDLLANTIEAVRVAKPPRVYLALDGPRLGRSDDLKVIQCRALVSALDWGCEVRTLFREHNLGCGKGVSGAISWFFETEERGIILEDDILPDPTFFTYADELLERYAQDSRVGAITGTNFVPPDHQSHPDTYRFSRIPIVWGWATWRRAWAEYRFDIAGWRSGLAGQRARYAMGDTRAAQLLWSANFDLMARHAIDTWDLQFVYTCMSRSFLTAVPPVNLVENVGFRSDATHTQRLPSYLRAREGVEIPMRAPNVTLDEKADKWLMRQVYGASYAQLLKQGARFIGSHLSK
jgi:hypothetical protein